jgi:hypothetical protein
MQFPDNFPFKYVLILAIAIVAVGGVGYGVMMGNQPNTHTLQVAQPAQNDTMLNESEMMDNFANGTDNQNTKINEVSDNQGNIDDQGTLGLLTVLKHVPKNNKISKPINKPIIKPKPPVHQPNNGNQTTNNNMDNSSQDVNSGVDNNTDIDNSDVNSGNNESNTDNNNSEIDSGDNNNNTNPDNSTVNTDENNDNNSEDFDDGQQHESDYDPLDPGNSYNPDVDYGDDDSSDEGGDSSIFE